MNIKLFEDFNQKDENEVFLELVDECISACQRCLDTSDEDLDMENLWDDCIKVSNLIKDLVDNSSVFLADQKKVFRICLKKCVEKTSMLDKKLEFEHCIECCKRCLLDLDNVG